MNSPSTTSAPGLSIPAQGSLPVVRMIEQTRRVVRAMVAGYRVFGERDSAHQNWYIMVTAPDGCYAYDGWWKDSEDKSAPEVVEEAIRGACILKDYKPCPKCNGNPVEPEVAECCGCFECDFNGTLEGYERMQEMDREAYEAVIKEENISVEHSPE